MTVISFGILVLLEGLSNHWCYKPSEKNRPARDKVALGLIAHDLRLIAQYLTALGGQVRPARLDPVNRGERCIETYRSDANKPS